MSWIHSSKLPGILLAVTVVAVGTAAGLSVSGSAPQATNVNDSVSMSAEIQQPFEDQSSRWTLRPDSELDNATYTVRVFAQGRLVDQQGPVEGTVTQDLDFEESPTPNRIVVNVTGGVPALTDSEFSYENRSAENYTVLRLTNADSGATLQTWRSHRFTNGSNAARQAIADAEAAVTGDSPESARENLDRAISAYDGQNWQNAEELASEAEQTADAASSGGLPVVLIGVAVVVLAVAVGAALYLRGGDDEEYKLQ